MIQIQSHDFARYLDALCCPKCVAKVVLTKEKILFCQNCLTGYRLVNGVPNLHPSESIDFKKLAQSKQNGKEKGKRALITVMLGKKKQKTF